MATDHRGREIHAGKRTAQDIAAAQLGSTWNFGDRERFDQTSEVKLKPSDLTVSGDYDDEDDDDY